MNFPYLQIIFYISIFVLAALVSGNNLSSAIGTVTGSNVIRKRVAVLLGMTGFISGFIVGEQKMEPTVRLLFPEPVQVIIAVIWGSIIIFLVANRLRVPISLTMSIVGISLGLSIGARDLFRIFKIEEIIGMWVLAPVLAVAFSLIIAYLFQSMKKEKHWKMAVWMRLLLMILAFASSFTLGENTLGFIGALGDHSLLAFIVVIVGIMIGSIFLSEGVLRRVGYEIYSLRYSSALISLLSSTILVEVATLFGIPLSNTQTMTSSIMGVGLASKTRVISVNPLVKIFLLWFVSPIIGLFVGLLIHFYP